MDDPDFVGRLRSGRAFLRAGLGKAMTSKARRNELIESGFCPRCGGRNRLAPGLKRCIECGARRTSRSTFHRDPEPPRAPVDPGPSVWDCPETDLERAVREAEVGLGETG